MSLQTRILAGAAATALTALAVREAARAVERANPPRGTFFDLGDVRLHVLMRGAGEGILYLHGNGAMIQEVEATGLVDALSATHRVIVPDRPGFGHSTRPRHISWTPERQARAIAELLNRVAPGPVTVVAHSWGTLVALALALDHPAHVRGLVLVSGPYFPEPRSDLVLAAPALPVIGDLMRYTVSPMAGWAVSESVIEKAFAPNPVTPRFRAEFPIGMALRPWQLRAAAEEIAMMQTAPARLSARYRELACPVTLLSGRADQIVDPRRHTERLAAQLPHARIAVIENVGHMLPHIVPTEVMRAATDRAAAEPAMHAI